MSSNEVVVGSDHESYRPGDLVTGQVMWFCSKVPSSITIDLVWKTSGRGSTDKKKVNSIKVPCSTQKGESRFELGIPQNVPASYSGSLVSILWSLECRADISWKIDPKNSQELIISPTGKAFVPPKV